MPVAGDGCFIKVVAEDLIPRGNGRFIGLRETKPAARAMAGPS